jgi:Na+-transporting NADH:ubiquinone oxidoreductase subunit NqrC
MFYNIPFLHNILFFTYFKRLNPNLAMVDLPVIILTTLILLILVGLALAAGAYFIFHPIPKRSRMLNKQSQIDFNNARGTHHLTMLRKASQNLERKIRTLDSFIQEKQNEQRQFTTQRDKTLWQALEKHIAFDRITEVPRIGPKMRDKILSETFNGRL